MATGVISAISVTKSGPKNPTKMAWKTLRTIRVMISGDTQERKENTILRKLESIAGHFLPNRSAIRPERTEPITKETKIKLAWSELTYFVTPHSFSRIGIINVKVIICAPSDKDSKANIA